MHKTCANDMHPLRGLPAALMTDDRWLDGPTPHGDTPKPSSHDAPRRAEFAVLLILLRAMLDILICQVTPGLSLAVFGVVPVPLDRAALLRAAAAALA